MSSLTYYSLNINDDNKKKNAYSIYSGILNKIIILIKKNIY